MATWQPFEGVIIFGAGIGAYIIANPKTVLGGTAKVMGPLLRGSKYNTENCMELLGILYALFRLAKTKGDLALEMHVESPEESPIFQQFPSLASDHHTVEFLSWRRCDWRSITANGTWTVSSALHLPRARDRDAAVLGVIHTMGSSWRR